ncbi:MAG TPA: response regulator [Magnetospirillaceae bacterium]|jgi:CheY-like chemotaxis protein
MSDVVLERILYVDDEPDIQEIVGMALELMGDVEIKTCGSGREALALADSFRPNLIMLDVMMPEMDGPATLDALRRHPEHASIPVVFVTAKANTRELQRFIELGAVDVIAKPLDPMKLGDQVKKIWAATHGG